MSLRTLELSRLIVIGGQRGIWLKLNCVNDFSPAYKNIKCTLLLQDGAKARTSRHDHKVIIRYSEHLIHLGAFSFFSATSELNTILRNILPYLCYYSFNTRRVGGKKKKEERKEEKEKKR